MGTPKTTEDVPVVSPTFLFSSNQARLRGYPLSCDPGAVAILDIEVTAQLLVQGGAFWMANTQFGDRAQFSVVDKNNVLGLHVLHGIPMGYPIELVRYVEDYYPPTAALWDDDIIMPTVAPVAPGLFMRMTYEAINAGARRDMAVLYRWYIDGAGP